MHDGNKCTREFNVSRSVTPHLLSDFRKFERGTRQAPTTDDTPHADGGGRPSGLAPPQLDNTLLTDHEADDLWEWHTTAILSPCCLGRWMLQAGTVLPKASHLLCAECTPPLRPWHLMTGVAISCPHGFVALANTHAPPPRECHAEGCRRNAEAIRRVAATAQTLPAKADPIRWKGEVDMRAHNAQEIFLHATTRPFGAVAFHEHTGSFRDEWAKLGVLAASVANRPTLHPPLGDSVHFIANAEEWHASYSWEIPIATAHPDCHTATTAAPNSRRGRQLRHLLSGALYEALCHVVWILTCIGPRVAMEQPDTLFAKIIGPPTQKTNVATYGCPRRKEWWWWLVSLPEVPPSSPLQGPQPSEHKDHAHLRSELRSIARAATPPSLARQHARAWLPFAKAEPRKRQDNTSAYSAFLRAAQARLTLVAAAELALVLDTPWPPRAVILIPATLINGVMHALLPPHSFYGSAVPEGADLDAAAARVARSAACTMEPMLAHKALEGGVAHYIYVVPPNTSPDPDDLLHQGDHPLHRAEWTPETTLADSYRRVYTSLALSRFSHVFLPAHGVGAVIGVSGPPIPLSKEPNSCAWRRGEVAPGGQNAWRSLLTRDGAAAAKLKAELRNLDNGDGHMLEWATTITSIRSVAAALDLPPQGPPPIPQGAQWTRLPDIYEVPDPLPLTSQMLARLPPQALPPGPLPTHASEILTPWARRLLFNTAKGVAAREAYFFSNPPPTHKKGPEFDAWMKAAPKAPNDLIVGDGGFRLIPHADGIGSWRANAIIFDVRSDGQVSPLDTTKPAYTHWCLEALRRHFEPGDDLELLSHVFDGLRYKAARPRQMRIATNMDSLATHVKAVADDISKLADANMYKVRPLRWLTGPNMGDTEAWPISTLPAWTAPVGAVDKKDKVHEKRRVSNGSWPYKEPLARELPHGEPTGPPCKSFNELAGPMRPTPYTSLSTTPFTTTPWGSPCDFCRSPVWDSTDGEHSWWGRLYCRGCWESGEAIAFEPLKWHRERKHSASTVYQAAAALLSLAQLANESVYSITTDYRWWFWQFGTHPCEYWTSQFLAVVKLGDEYAVCLVGELVANMGRSPVSNIASSVGSRLFEPIRRRADAREPVLLKREPLVLQSIMEERSAKLGLSQARLFWSGCFTDDTLTLVLGALRAALIAYDIADINREINVFLADPSKCPMGTHASHIGAIILPNAGIATISREKRARSLHHLRLMREGTLSCTEFQEAAGLVGHVIQILLLDQSLMSGLGRQLQFAVDNNLEKVVLSRWSTEALGRLEEQISTVPFVSIFTVLSTATTPMPVGSTPKPTLVIASDACTGSHDEFGNLVDWRGAPDPAIFAHAGCYYVRFPLTGRWREVHITVTEPLGQALGAMTFAPRFPHILKEMQGDARCALAFLMGRSKSRTLQRIYLLWKEWEGFTEFMENAVARHIAGHANTFADAGSRGHWDIFETYAAAMGFRMVEIPIDPQVQAFMDSALAIALEENESNPNSTETGVEHMPSPARLALPLAPRGHLEDSLSSHGDTSASPTPNSTWEEDASRVITSPHPPRSPSSSTPSAGEVIQYMSSHFIKDPASGDTKRLNPPGGPSPGKAAHPYPDTRHEDPEEPPRAPPAALPPINDVDSDDGKDPVDYRAEIIPSSDESDYSSRRRRGRGSRKGRAPPPANVPKFRYPPNYQAHPPTHLTPEGRKRWKADRWRQIRNANPDWREKNAAESRQAKAARRPRAARRAEPAHARTARELGPGGPHGTYPAVRSFAPGPFESTSTSPTSNPTWEEDASSRVITSPQPPRPPSSSTPSAGEVIKYMSSHNTEEPASDDMGWLRSHLWAITTGKGRYDPGTYKRPRPHAMLPIYVQRCQMYTWHSHRPLGPPEGPLHDHQNYQIPYARPTSADNKKASVKHMPVSRWRDLAPIPYRPRSWERAFLPIELHDDGTMTAFADKRPLGPVDGPLYSCDMRSIINHASNLAPREPGLDLAMLPVTVREGRIYVWSSCAPLGPARPSLCTLQGQGVPYELEAAHGDFYEPLDSPPLSWEKAFLPVFVISGRVYAAEDWHLLGMLGGEVCDVYKRQKHYSQGYDTDDEWTPDNEQGYGTYNGWIPNGDPHVLPPYTQPPLSPSSSTPSDSEVIQFMSSDVSGYEGDDLKPDPFMQHLVSIFGESNVDLSFRPPPEPDAWMPVILYRGRLYTGGYSASLGPARGTVLGLQGEILQYGLPDHPHLPLDTHAGPLAHRACRRAFMPVFLYPSYAGGLGLMYASYDQTPLGTIKTALYDKEGRVKYEPQVLDQLGLGDYLFDPFPSPHSRWDADPKPDLAHLPIAIRFNQMYTLEGDRPLGHVRDGVSTWQEGPLLFTPATPGEGGGDLTPLGSPMHSLERAFFLVTLWRGRMYDAFNGSFLGPAVDTLHEPHMFGGPRSYTPSYSSSDNYAPSYSSDAEPQEGYTPSDAPDNEPQEGGEAELREDSEDAPHRAQGTPPPPAHPTVASSEITPPSPTSDPTWGENAAQLVASLQPLRAPSSSTPSADEVIQYMGLLGDMDNTV